MTRRKFCTWLTLETLNIISAVQGWGRSPTKTAPPWLLTISGTRTIVEDQRENEMLKHWWEVLGAMQVKVGGMGVMQLIKGNLFMHIISFTLHTRLEYCHKA